MESDNTTGHRNKFCISKPNLKFAIDEYVTITTNVFINVFINITQTSLLFIYRLLDLTPSQIT